MNTSNVYQKEDEKWYFALYNEDDDYGPYETYHQALLNYLEALKMETH